MKKILFIALLFLGFSAKAQHQDITVSTLSAVYNHYLVSYEYIYSSDKSLGLQLGFGDVGDVYYDDFSITPYYRYYTGEDANLLFYELFLKTTFYRSYEDNYSGIAPGVGFGWKGKIGEHILIGFNLGVGYNITKFTKDEFAKRGALFIGFRF